MGRSKFPGKPSKFVNKKRVSVLQTDENSVNNDDNENGSGNGGGSGSGSGRRDDNSSGGNNVNDENSEENKGNNDQISSRNGTLGETSKLDGSSAGTSTSLKSIDTDTEKFQKISVSQSREKPPSSEPPDGGGNNEIHLKVIGVTTRARNTNITPVPQSNGNNNTSAISNNSNSKREKNLCGAEKQPTKKKTVTFKNILETSDDACTVKKVYNPDNKAPLVPIIKRECLSRSVRLARNDCIVRPSRLTEILKNNANNIDKLNFLKFRSSIPLNSNSPPQSVSPSNLDTNLELSSNSKCNSLLENSEKIKDDSEVNSNRYEKGVIVGDKRFVLPKRSAHSCRVIKPNKRFLEDTELFTKSSINLKKNSNLNLKTNSSINKKTNRLFSTFNDAVDNQNGNFECNKNQKNQNDINDPKQVVCLHGENEFDNISETSNTTDEIYSDAIDEDEDEMENNLAFFSNPFTRCNKSLFNTMTTSNKIILRQPRLQFDTQNLNLFDQSNLSPFSLNLNCNSKSGLSQLNLGTTNSCAICSTTISGKTQQQSKKYGIYACDVCRKFISKITKKAVASTNNIVNHQSNMILQCNRGDGTCPIVPLAKINLKSLKKSYKDRCPACWLKKSIQLFNIPSGHKQRLSSILPTSLIKDISIDCKNALKTNGNSIMIPTSSTPFSIKKDATITGNEKTSINLYINPTKKLLNWTSSITCDNLFDSNYIANLNTSMTTTDTVNQKSITPSLSNSLLEKNTTFGVLPLSKPTILEKPVFMKGNSETNTVITETIEKDISQMDNNNKALTLCNANEKDDIRNSSVSNETNKIKLRRKEKDYVVTSSEITTLITTQTSTIATQSITLTTNNVLTDYPKRQRIDLKGPRVKHVCRSASIVLGQPIATFSNDIPILESMDTPPRPESPTNAEVEMTASVITDTSCSTCTHHQQNNQNSDVTNLGLSPPATPIEFSSPDECSNDSESKHKDVFDKSIQTKVTNLNMKFDGIQNQLREKKIVASRLPLTSNNSNNNVTTTTVTMPRNLNSFSKKYLKPLLENSTKKPKIATMISIDFWENYDPAEVSQTGFGLIVTESIPMRALCFLCGSIGVEPMIFCACCCEPYHQYCVEDEYNLKHSSLDETMLSLLDTSLNPVENLNLITNRLNWLCPRCTVCYTCNMSSGSKVKCQKCQKNYHTTCLGTSKRLLGADRPLICVNCLKCKSCSTTKVSKFVGNLPMCSQCFKLRKKGNFCPICQKCYEENDFDLKMMECGDCQKWVHSKCEGLSDEQYNLLSTLPESIEFICRKCSILNEQSKERATEWRSAVSLEFKSGLLSVVKLLSKSRQACALLKLSPRKKTIVDCVCRNMNNTAVSRSLNFNKLEPQGNSDVESHDSDDISMEDVYEFKETNSVSKVGNCYCSSKTSNNKFLPINDTLSLVDIKRKVNASEYISLSEFNYDMNNVITAANCDDLIITYKEILSEQFPWFQNETKACTDALEEDMFDSCTYSQSVENVESDQQVPVIDLPSDIDDCLFSPNFEADKRICVFCKKNGEGNSSEESRLIYCGHNSWVHINCAMWSAEVFEEIDGSLQNVHSAISRGRMIKCTVCSNRGATIGCNVKSCGEHYHFSCAKRINCAFMTDKTVFCPEHLTQVNKVKFTNEKNFEVLRPVYVELDRKRKKLVDPIKVKFLIGSLEIKKLGRIYPKFSDTNEAIVPVDFHCTRLYWSTKEPWKIVEYTVTTSIQNNLRQFPNDLGRNFTVDHSNNINLVQVGLAQISRWHNSLLLGEDIDNVSTFYRQNNSIKQFIESSGQHVNTTEDGNEEEPQNNADLLPPEIKDAIFEDLPHEILDGISMLDIFPKLMIYEDIIAMDPKTENYFLNEHSKDNGTNLSEDELDESNQKELELGQIWSSNNLVNHVEDAMLSAIRPLGSGVGREIKRSKSELLSRSVGGNRSQQRSSSLTWGCKFDNNAIKRRKITKGMQDIRIPESVLLSLGHRKLDFPPRSLTQQIEENNINSKTKTFMWSSSKKSQNTDDILSKDEKLKISQLDGMDDSILENSSNYQHQFFGNSDGPVKCVRCQCTYRSNESFQRHLATCEAFSTSESESETPRSPDAQSPTNQNSLFEANKTPQHLQNNQQQPISFLQNVGQTMPMTSIQNNLVGNSSGLPLTTFNNSNIPLNNVQLQMSQFNQGIQNIFVNNTTSQHQHQTQQQFYPVSLQNLNTTNLNNVSFSSSSSSALVNPTISFSTSGIQQQQMQQPHMFTMSTADGNQQVVTITPNGQQTIRTSSNQIYQQHGQQQMLRTQIDSKQSPTKISKYSPKTKQKSASSRPIQMKKKPSTILHHQQHSSVQILNQSQIQHQQQQQQQQQQPQNSYILQQSSNGGQPIILQQIGGNPTATTHQNVPQNILSYVTDNGNNPLQYVTLPNANEFKPQQQQFLTTTNQLVQGAYLQADVSGNLVLTNGTPGLQVLSAAPLQLQSTQPQVIGTLIQPQALQLGGSVMSTDQMMLGGSSTLEMLGNSMILANQPVYYGLETIVQNTVMQSQQFVSTAMQGVLSQNASFSATTTQVFQASKIEPIVDVPTGYVVLNNVDGSTTIVQQPTSHTNLLSANVLQQPTLTQIQSQHIHNSQPQQQLGNQQVQPIYSIQTPQQTVTQSAIIHPNQLQQTTNQVHQPQPNLISNPLGSGAQSSLQPGSMSTTRPVAKSAPIVMTKIQPQVVNKVIPTLTSLQEHKLNNSSKSSKTVSIAPAMSNSNLEAINVKPINDSSNILINKSVKTSNGLSSAPHVIKPKVTSTQSSSSTNSVQRKTNMIKPLNKVSSISIKPKSRTPKVALNNKTAELNLSNLQMAQQQPPLKTIDQNHQTSRTEMKETKTIEENPIAFVQSNVLNNSIVPQKIDQLNKNQSNNINIVDFEEIKSSCTNTTIKEVDSRLNEVNSSICDKIKVQDKSEPIIIMPSQVKEFTPMYAQHIQPSPPITNLNQHNIQQYTSSSKPSFITQTATMSTSSIQLPSAPFVVSSFNNNSNVPTNIVNPIQQNQNSSNVSRPTNRVLPMQSVQLKQQLASPKTHKLFTKSDMDKEKTSTNDKHDSGTIDSINSIEFDSVGKETSNIENILSNTIVNQIDDILCKSECRSINNDIEQLSEDSVQVVIPSELAKDVNEEASKVDLNEINNKKNDDFNGKDEDNEIQSIPDCDNLSNSTTTPEVQEKISEILENLENEEDNKAPLLAEDSLIAENISRTLDEVDTVDQKENNMNPINHNCNDNVFKNLSKNQTEKKSDHIKQSGPKLLYEIQSQDGFTYKSTSITDIWEKVFEAVQVARKAHGLLALPEGPLADMSGIQMLGLKTNALRYLIEQLPGVERCTKYTPKYHQRQQLQTSSSGYSSDQEELKENPFGAARFEPYSSRSEYDMFSWLASSHRKQPIQIFLQPSDNELIPRRGTGSNLPMAMKYRTLKETYKDYVGVFRSHIHGRGLYCKKDIEAGEMVIEYAGELIRSTLTDKRERYYDSKGIGCYMFKIDENLVVDATMRGNAARFINHACEPNCYSKVVDILGHKHIIIFALRRIVQGEELTYDYKFPFEEVKIPCSCGSKKCRKYLN